MIPIIQCISFYNCVIGMMLKEAEDEREFENCTHEIMRATELFRCRFPSLMDARMMEPMAVGVGCQLGAAGNHQQQARKRKKKSVRR